MEKELQKKCVDYARSLGLMIYSVNPANYKWMTYGNKKNMPDLHIVDINTFIELKDAAYKKAHSERQLKQAKVRAEIWQHNGKAYKCDTFDKFKLILKFLMR